MSTAKQMQVAIGARINVRCESMQIECIVEDVKNSWGQARLLVRPVAGTGQQWVEMSRVRVPEPPAGADPAKAAYVREETAALDEFYNDRTAGLRQFLREN